MKLIIAFTTLILLVFIIKLKRKVLNNTTSIWKFSIIYCFIAFICIYFLIPSIPIKWYDDSNGVFRIINKFSEIHSVEIYSKDEKIQTLLSENNDINVREDFPMFLSYILIDQGIEIKDSNWLVFLARTELNINIVQHPDQKEDTVFSTSYNGVDYFAQFGNENNQTYMKYVIKGKLR